MTRKFGIGIIGVGVALPPHARALKALGDTIKVRGIYSRNEARRNAAAELYGFPAVASVALLLADPEIDAIVLLTPPNARTELVEAIAKAGKHLFMEKPIERTTGAAAAIVDFCASWNIRLGITFQHRFRESSLRAKALLDSGRAGAIAAVHLVVPWWRPLDYYAEPGRGTFAQDGGGVLITQAIHSLDLMLSLAGPVAEVQAMAGTTKLHDIEVEDFVGAGLGFANGALGALMATTAHYPGRAESLTIACEKATLNLSGNRLTVDWHDGGQETFGAEAGTGRGDNRMAFPYHWHKAQIAEFVAAVQAERDPVSSGRTALEVHRLIDALLLSAHEGRRITVKRG